MILGMVLSNGHSKNAGSVVGYLEVVWILKPYHMQKNLFELFALTDIGDEKTSGARAT